MKEKEAMASRSFDTGFWGGKFFSSSFLLFGTFVFFGVLNLLFLFSGFFQGTLLDHVSGAWSALAMDLREGIFYRPLFDPDVGYGGTRFFPVYFGLLAGFFLLLGNIVIAGFTINLLILLFLVLGVFFFLKKYLDDYRIVFLGIVLLLVPFTLKAVLTQFRGDILAIVFNLWGVIFVLRGGRTGAIFGSLLFSLAVFTKFTAIHGFAIMVLFYFFSRDYRKVLLLLGWGFSFLAFMGAIMVLFSDGDWFEIFRVCSFGERVYHPVQIPRKIMGIVFRNDIVGGLLIFLGFLSSFFLWKQTASRIPFLYFWVSIPITFVIFSSSGINYNHLANLILAGILSICFALHHAHRRFRLFCVVFLGLILLASIFYSNGKYGWILEKDKLARYGEVKAYLAELDGPYLSEDPFIPVLDGKRPYLLDPYMFRAIARKRPELVEHCYQKLASRAFSAVVLMSENNPDNYLYSVHFGGKFRRLLEENYRLTQKKGGFFIFTPMME